MIRARSTRLVGSVRDREISSKRCRCSVSAGSAITRRGATTGSPNPIPHPPLTTSHPRYEVKRNILIFRNLYTRVSDCFEARLRAGQFAITAEISPPLSSDRAHLLERAMPLAGLADAVNITDGASARVHLGAVTAAGILVEHDIEPILQFTCRDRNRIALQSDLLAAAALGVRNL